ncbi:hypothetical protein WJX74_004137 [Apatococcus lobatus]|uniref:Uncharacterized protein n=1 Tax=Apatococcus lobatus TaxID=904363 RepID=A0AAW1RA43_9CHLO
MSVASQTAPVRNHGGLAHFSGSTCNPISLFPSPGWLRSTSGARLRHQQAQPVLQAQRSRQESWRDDDYVELDDEEDWQDEDPKSSTSFQSLISGAVPQVLALSERISEFVFYFFPEGTSRTAVDTIVKAGLVLLALGIARSLLGFVTTVGGVVLAFFIIKSFLGKDDGTQQGPASRSSGARRRSDKASPRGFLSSGRAEPSRDWSDVWIDRKATSQKERQPRQ